jgi:hypothetical protein
MATLVMLLLSQLPGPPAALVQLDREMGGMLDAYLEAVPECPVMEDTPVRLWLLDLALVRAEGAYRRAFSEPPPSDGDLRAAVKRYLSSCEAYLAVFTEVRDALRAGSPGPEECERAERGILSADSSWTGAGSRLFGLILEEGWR